MRDPAELMQQPHPGPQGYENVSPPIKSKGFPWIKMIVGVAVLFLLYRAATSLGKTSDETQAATTNSKPVRSVSGIFSRGSEDDTPDPPMLMYVIGREAMFSYDGLHYRLPDGVGPIGADWFCGMLDGGIATITSSDGRTARIGVVRANSPDLWRSSRNTSGQGVGEVRAPK